MHAQIDSEMYLISNVSSKLERMSERMLVLRLASPTFSPTLFNVAPTAVTASNNVAILHLSKVHRKFGSGPGRASPGPR